jgi:hypothetical protein
MNALKKLALVTLGLATTSLASAATFDFDRGTGSTLSFNSYDVYSQTEDGISVSVVGIGGQNKVSQSRNQGLGVGTGFFNYLIADNEKLTFTFDQAVDINQIVLNSYGNGTLTWEGGSIAGLDGNTNTSQGLNAKFHTINLSNITSFTVEADQNYLMVDGLVGVTASVSAVPVPAAAWLFGSALIGLAGIGRKRG